MIQIRQQLKDAEIKSKQIGTFETHARNLSAVMVT